MLKYLWLLLQLLLYSAFAASENSLEIITLNNRPAEEVQPLLTPLLDPEDRVIADGANLIIRAAPERLEQIRNLVAQLDTNLHNLLITVQQGHDLNADALNASANLAVEIPLHHPSAAKGVISGQFNEGRSQASSNNTQTLRTLEGETAHIQAGQAVPIPSITVYDSGYGYPAAAESTALIEATTGFAVTPRLNGDHVLLAVSPWSDRLQHNGAISTQSATTNLRARLGEWVEIGSIQDSSHYQQRGALSRIRENSSSDLHILVKVEIID